MPSAPPLSDRTLKYGRNVMATAGVVIVLAWVPEIDVGRFHPFGFDFLTGGKLSAWSVLCAVLVYYFGSFGFAAAIDIPEWHRQQAGELSRLTQNLAAMRASSREGNENARQSAAASVRTQRVLRFTRWRLWWLDLGLPAAMFVAALSATISRLAALWPVGDIGI